MVETMTPSYKICVPRTLVTQFSHFKKTKNIIEKLAFKTINFQSNDTIHSSQQTPLFHCINTPCICTQSENIAYVEEDLNLKLLNLRKIMKKIYNQRLTTKTWYKIITGSRETTKTLKYYLCTRSRSRRSSCCCCLLLLLLTKSMLMDFYMQLRSLKKWH